MEKFPLKELEDTKGTDRNSYILDDRQDHGQQKRNQRQTLNWKLKLE